MKTNWNVHRLAWLLVLLPFLLSFAYMNFAKKNVINAKEFALAQTNTTRTEYYGGYLIATNYYDQIYTIFQQIKTRDCGDKSVLWLGNSQQHTINHFVDGEHLSVYWLAKKLAAKSYKPGCVIGISLPNVNPSEILHLIQYIEKENIYFDTMILPLEFMGYRESGVREEMKNVLSLQNSPETGITYASKKNEKQILRKHQWIIEPKWLENINGMLDQLLGNNVAFWRNRLDIQSTFISKLYQFRNIVFGIKSATVRRAIPARMNENIKAFKSIVKYIEGSQINSVFYFVPIRPYNSFPYHVGDFDTWKDYLNEVLSRNGNITFDFTNLIKEEYWGSNFKNDIDFMHFTGQGHKIIAESVYKIIMSKVLKAERA